MTTADTRKVQNLLSTAGVGKGSVVCVQSALRNICDGHLSPQVIVDAIMELVGDDGSIIMPAYNFHSWTEQSFFSVNSTPSEVGFLTEFFRKSPGVQRTSHPIHSLSVWGANATRLQEVHSVNSFAGDSVFSVLHAMNITYLTLGTGLDMPFLPCHYTESRMGVGYRIMKLFRGRYISADGIESQREYGFEVKKDEFRSMISPVYQAHIDLHRRGIVSMEKADNTVVCWAKAQDYDLGFVQFMEENPELFKN